MPDIGPAIGKDNYSGPFPTMKKFIDSKSEFIFPNENIDNDENFIIFIKFDSKFNLTVDRKKEKDDNNDFPLWAMILIIVVGVLIILFILFLIIRKIKKRETKIETIEKETLLKDLDD